MNEKKRVRVDGPEKKKGPSAKIIKLNITAMEKRIKELKTAIKETNNDFVRDQCKHELEIWELWLRDYKKDPANAKFDDFQPLYEKSSK